MTDYKDEIIKKAEEERAVLGVAIKHANEAIEARNHLNYLDKLNITRWVKAGKELEKTLKSLRS